MRIHKIIRIVFSSLYIILFSTGLHAQDIKIINPDLLKEWPASWVSIAGVPQKDYGVYHFRKSFNLTAKPSNLGSSA